MNILLKSSMHNCMLLIMTITVISLMASCSPPNEKAHPAYNKGENAMKKNNYATAAAGYQEYLCFNRRSAITHYKLAKLYGDYLDNPFLSAYHFREYLKYEPTSPDKEAIEAWIIAAEKSFAKQIQEKYPADFTSITEIEKLRDDKKRLINYAIKIKKQNATLLKAQRERTGLSGGSTKPREILVAADGMQEIYTVKSGDNLQKISRSVYGTSKYYKLIFDANRNTMKSESQLNIGQKLQIPKLKTATDQPPQKKEMEEESIEKTKVIIDYPTE
jgi:LysM domain-containing protein